MAPVRRAATQGLGRDSYQVASRCGPSGFGENSQPPERTAANIEGATPIPMTEPLQQHATSRLPHLRLRPKPLELLRVVQEIAPAHKRRL